MPKVVYPTIDDVAARDRQCLTRRGSLHRKWQYDTWDAAERDRVAAGDRIGSRVYRCEICRWFHFGSMAR